MRKNPSSYLKNLSFFFIGFVPFTTGCYPNESRDLNACVVKLKNQIEERSILLKAIPGSTDKSLHTTEIIQKMNFDFGKINHLFEKSTVEEMSYEAEFDAKQQQLNDLPLSIMASGTATHGLNQLSYRYIISRTPSTTRPQAALKVQLYTIFQNDQVVETEAEQEFEVHDLYKCSLTPHEGWTARYDATSNSKTYLLQTRAFNFSQDKAIEKLPIFVSDQAMAQSPLNPYQAIAHTPNFSQRKFVSAKNLTEMTIKVRELREERTREVKEELIYFDRYLNETSSFGEKYLDLIVGDKIIYTTKITFSQSSDYLFYETIGSSLTSHSLTQDQWRSVNLKLDSSSPDSHQVAGFTKRKLNQPRLTYQFEASSYLPPYPAISSYGSLEKSKESGKFLYLFESVSQKDTDPSDNVKPHDRHKYTKQTYYYDYSRPQIQEIIKNIEKTSPNLKHGDPLLFSSIDYELQRKFHYDYCKADFSFSNTPSKASELAKNGQGVCGHYSVLYVAIARGLGLPARTVLGYVINEQKISCHAWIEVLKDEDHWIPVEPQRGLPIHRGYIPISLPELYETRRQPTQHQIERGNRVNIILWNATPQLDKREEL